MSNWLEVLNEIKKECIKHTKQTVGLPSFSIIQKKNYLNNISRVVNSLNAVY